MGGGLLSSDLGIYLPFRPVVSWNQHSIKAKAGRNFGE